MRLLRILVACLILATSGCDDVPRTESNFRVTIDNLSSGEVATPLSGGVYYTREKSYPLFFSRSQDFGKGLEELAEDGNPEPLYNHLLTLEQIAVADSFPFLEPGQSASFEFSATYGSFFNFATMFVESNDLFYSFDEEGILLFEPDGSPKSGDYSSFIWLWDAGTEVNEEPYAGLNQPYRQGSAGLGQPENGNVKLVNDDFTYPSKFDVIRITIEPF